MIRDGRRLHSKARTLPAAVRHFIEPLVTAGAQFFGAAPDIASTIASVAAPAITGAGVGALGSALTGGKPLTGALIGGGVGALGGATGAAGALGNYLGLNDVGASLANTLGVTDTPGVDLGQGQFGPGATVAGVPSGAGASGTTSPLASTSSAVANGGGAGSGLFGGKGISGTAMALGILSALGSALSKPKVGTWTTPGPASTAANTGPNFTQPLNTNVPGRTPNQPATDWYTYGQRPEQSFFTGNSLQNFGFAHGGALAEAHGGRREFSTENGEHYVQGNGDGQADSVPAQLSDGEFVWDATTVSRLGNGSNRKGAALLEKARRAIAHDAGSDRVVQKKINKGPLEYLSSVGGKAA